jgi:hypothetical protein
MAVKLAQANYVPCGCLALLDRNDPRAELWKKVLGSLEFPLKGPTRVMGFGPGEPQAMFLREDWEALTVAQKSKIRAAMRDNFGASEAEFEQQMKTLGYFPIKDENITIRICGLHTRCMM